MPSVNIPGKYRFAAYLLASVLFIVVTYAVDKHWAGGAELKAVGGICALLNLLAASKTDTSDGQSKPLTLSVQGTLENVPAAMEKIKKARKKASTPVQDDEADLEPLTPDEPDTPLPTVES